jgi:hypothetical protein
MMQSRQAACSFNSQGVRQVDIAGNKNLIAACHIEKTICNFTGLRFVPLVGNQAAALTDGRTGLRTDEEQRQRRSSTNIHSKGYKLEITE